MNFENDIKQCLGVLENSGIFLYPTDTVWGIGCDAANEQAIKKIFTLKQRDDSRAMIILISNEIDISRYVSDPDPQILLYLCKAAAPTTAIYSNGKNIHQRLVSSDGSIAIRIVKDEFCTALINKFGRPIVSTSANISGKPAPQNFMNIDPEIKKGVDYIVQHRRSDSKVAMPSAIIKINEEKKLVVIRS